MPNEAQWSLLAKLFSSQDNAFRHRLGLWRSEIADFYAPTAEAVEILREKQAILDSGAGEQYLFESAPGWPALQEFARATGCGRAVSTFEADARACHIAITLALEPDWMLLAPGDWKLVWASVCFPTRWSLAGKGLQPLPNIHAVVPDLNSELGRKIDVFFGRLVPGEGWARANWGLSTSAERNQHPSLPYRPLRAQTPWQDVYVRVEAQHLVKLPETGAVAFGIRILSFALAAVAEHPSIIAGLKEQLRTIPAEVAHYKGIPADFWQRL